ncbi:MAG TPA: glycosyltransferase family 39 protein [Candidatus Binatia bacterium]|nr:glycosyltransferase family 39 protein [Candidatus Binatia bacterium]
MSGRLALVLALAVPLLAWRLDRPGFSDTEGMFAEPAREMVATGDWLVPRMNGEPFLTKPPLMYWLPASVFALAGPTEYARVWPALAALATVALTGLLGAALFDETAGVAAAVVLATSLGFLVEARMLRADMALMLAVTLALYCYVRLRRGGGTAAALAFWATIGIGVLDKGLLAVLLPGGAIGLAEIAAGELGVRTIAARLRALRAPLGVLVLAVVVVPWHLLVAERTPGFLWDYVVNQHLLFFFDAKLPRDSIPDTLGFFWTMFVVRALPWGLLLPAALIHAARTLGRRPALRLPLAWIAVVLVFFSLAASRLEHYSLPALPAVALVVGLLLADSARGQARVGLGWSVLPPAAVAAAALAAALRDPAPLIARLDPTLLAYGVARLGRPAAATLALGLGATALCLVRRRAAVATLTAAATAATLFGFVQIAHERVEPLFSWRRFAETIRADFPADTPVFFRAPDEYQLCGGLDFYTRRYVALLAPPGWVPPTFLAGRTERLFTPRAELARVWRDGPALFVSDDVAAPGDEAALVPGPYAVVARAGERVLLRSQPRVARR